MKPSIKVISLCILATSYQADVRDINEYQLTDEIAEEHLPLYLNYRTKYHMKNDAGLSLFSKLLLLLKLPAMLKGEFLVDEIAEIIFNKYRSDEDPNVANLLKSPKQFNYRILVEVKDYSLSEAIDLFQMDLKARQINSICGYQAEDKFLNVLLASPILLQRKPLFKTVNNLLDRGISQGILAKLLRSKMGVFLENAHLKLWERPLGDLLIIYAKGKLIRYYDSYTLEYLDQNPKVQDLIMLAHRENFPTSIIVMMIDFPEKVEIIYATPEYKVLKDILWDDLSDFRQEIAMKMNWSYIEWSSEMRKYFRNDPSWLRFKANLIFDGLFAYIETEDIARIFGNALIYYDLRLEYPFSKIIDETPEFIYFYLKSHGFPIRDTSVILNEEVENEIWEHYKLHGEGTDWITLKATEIIREKYSIPYSQAVFGGSRLIEMYFESSLPQDRESLLYNLDLCLSNYFGTSIDLSVERDGRYSRLSGPSSDRSGGKYLLRFKNAFLFRFATGEFYPIVVKKLKQDNDPVLRDMLLEIVERITLKRLGKNYYYDFLRTLRGFSKINIAFKKNLNFQGWSEDINNLPKNILQLHSLYHRQIALFVGSISNIGKEGGPDETTLLIDNGRNNAIEDNIIRVNNTSCSEMASFLLILGLLLFCLTFLPSLGII